MGFDSPVDSPAKFRESAQCRIERIMDRDMRILMRVVHRRITIHGKTTTGQLEAQIDRIELALLAAPIGRRNHDVAGDQSLTSDLHQFGGSIFE